MQEKKNQVLPPRERLKLIKQLQLHNISIQEVWRNIAMPGQLFMVSIYTTSCLYAAIRLMDTVPWYLSPLFPLTLVLTSVFAATAYTLFANILEQSVDLRAPMKRAPMSKELRKAYLAVFDPVEWTQEICSHLRMRLCLLGLISSLIIPSPFCCCNRETSRLCCSPNVL